MSITLDALIFATGWQHILLSPYTKVEESFNLHATHDVLMYGFANLQNYDHFTFPGAVPRTFIGSILLAWLTTPIAYLARWAGYIPTKFDMQILARLVLASLNAWTLCLIRRGVTRRFGRSTGLFFSLLSCSQFHLPFWMGRTIPNMFAMIPVNISGYLLLDRAPNSKKPSEKSITYAVGLLTFTAVVVRAEVALLLGPLCLQLLYSRQISILSLIQVGFIAGIFSLALTVIVDSYFWWKFPLWPEFSGIYFNVVEGKSSEWGTSPPLTYVTSYLPKLLLGSLPLSLVGLASDQRIRSLLLPSFIFIGLISNLGHKEWRFIIYVVPLFNVAAARGARWMVSRRKNSISSRFFFLLAVGILVGNLFITSLFTRASMYNYPGGEALTTLHHLYGSDNSIVQVHISNLAAQTGASLFLQSNAPPYYFAPTVFRGHWIYNKTENLTVDDLSSSCFHFTHLISEVSPADHPSLKEHWKTVRAIKSFDRWAINWDMLKGKTKDSLLIRGMNVLYLKDSEKLWILKRVFTGKEKVGCSSFDT